MPTIKGRGQIPGGRPAGTNRIILSQESVHDTYRIRGKLPEPTVCPECGAVFHKGRWTWAEQPAGANEHRCPACSRIRDQYPAGTITISGPYWASHRDEILNLARNQETAERAEHPLARIMAVEEHPDRVTIATTDFHLPQRIGEALQRAHEGDLKIDYDGKSVVRVTWSRS